MGFFKNIGKGLKKAVKQVSFKNLVKVAGSGLSLVPGVGGIAGGLIQNMQANHEAKKQEQQMIAEQQAQQQAYDQAMSQEQARLSIKDVVNAGVGGALTGVGSAIAGTQQVGNIGAKVTDSTIKAWFKMHWWKVLIGLSAFLLLIRLAVKGKSNNRKRAY